MLLLSKIYLSNIKFFINVTKQIKRCLSSNYKETTCIINNLTINYLKIGTGKHNILCLPGALGTIWTDFKPQIERLNREKFSLVVWDPPGYGKSRPPPRQFDTNFYETDANVAMKLMDRLNIHKYSLLGWSDGGVTALILAAKYPDKVDALIVWGANSFLTRKDIDFSEKIRNIDNWSEKTKNTMIELYGEEYFHNLLEQWCDTMLEIYEKRKGNICDHILSDIKSRTLIIHGNDDAMIGPEHATNLQKKIQGAKLHILSNGKHNLHLKYAETFNAIVTTFLLNEK